ncbi:ventricular zone-expressed PH domain-containing protein homolog 1 [Discoglossus pictus]
MHHLFDLVLGQKDLSRAGDLFSLDDAEIEASLSEALEQIKLISSSVDYQTNDNDQAVVEICITRITTAIRETESIEKHCKALVSLWESCLEHNLKPPAKDEDTPHAKIASDIMSCILQNYNKPTVMLLAVPIAVKFLQRGNKELCRNMSSYISLAAIAKADLLADHTEAIVSSIVQGNSMLMRVLPSVYGMQPQPINQHLKELVSQMPHLEEGEQHHLLRLLQAVARRKQPKVLKEAIPILMEYLSITNYSDIILNILIEISAYEPLALANSLSTLKEFGENFPNYIGQIAKMYGAVGLVDEEMAKICLIYLVNQLTNMEHSFHHILLMEIKNITGTFNAILGNQSSDIYRMSNSFTTMATILNQHLENESVPKSRFSDSINNSEGESLTENGSEFQKVKKLKKSIADENVKRKESEPQADSPFYNNDAQQTPFDCVDGDGQKIQVTIQDVDDQGPNNNALPDTSYIYGDGIMIKEQKKDKRINRSKNLPLNSLNKKCMSLDNGQDIGHSEVLGLISFSPLLLNQEEERLTSGTDKEKSQVDTLALSPIINYSGTKSVPEQNEENQNITDVITESPRQDDKLLVHLKENLNELKKYVVEMAKKIPVPDQCVIEDTIRSCVAKLFFSCPMKGHYCLYSKSSFILISRQPQLWIHIMFLFQQSLFPEPLSMQSTSMQLLRTLWEKTQLKGTHSFETSIIQSMFPHKKDLDLLLLHLEDVRFFDLFGFCEEAGSWQCFMCNNPEKATVVNQEGQPLIEGKLKEKQVRWKFIKRWKTRYFTLAGNQLLFRKGKSKDDQDDCPIELSKVQSVKVVAKKRRDRSLPRAFEIFTDNKTYVFKAKDEKNAEEWLQCINVAVAQAKERESWEATTYL